MSGLSRTIASLKFLVDGPHRRRNFAEHWHVPDRSQLHFLSGWNTSVFEELIHATQFGQGLNDGSLVSRLENEIAAQKVLLKNSKAYKLTIPEMKQTEFVLISYTKELQDLVKGK